MHRNGKPHVNVVMSNDEIARQARHDYRRFRRDWWIPNLVDVGFGRRCWVKPLYDRGSMAGYMTKLGLELHGATNKDQIPVNAPKHFRRLRATRGLLPPRHKNDNISGQLFKMRYEAVLSQLEGSPNLEADPMQSELRDYLPPAS